MRFFDEKELNDLLEQNNLTSISAHVSFESLEDLNNLLK